jgi:hypothetical protein
MCRGFFFERGNVRMRFRALAETRHALSLTHYDNVRKEKGDVIRAGRAFFYRKGAKGRKDECHTSVISPSDKACLVSTYWH